MSSRRRRGVCRRVLGLSLVPTSGIRIRCLRRSTLAFNEGVLGATFDEESGVLGFNVTTYDESFTYDLATQLVQNTESQFKDWKRQKGLSAVRAFQGKVDSLEIALDATLRRLGEYQDQNNSLISAVDKMEQMRLTIDMEALKVCLR